jgi:hypothetical protein
MIATIFTFFNHIVYLDPLPNASNETPRRARRPPNQSASLPMRVVHQRRLTRATLNPPLQRGHLQPNFHNTGRRIDQEVTSTLTSSLRRPESPADDADETSSIAESSTGVRVRRTEPERMQYLKDQPECSELEAHRAFCTRCNSWVNLGKPRTYTVRRWEVHRVKCDQKPPAEKESVSYLYLQVQRSY